MKSTVARPKFLPFAALQVFAATFLTFTTVRAQEITINAVGDMHFDRGVRAAIQRYGRDYVFENTSQVLAGDDLTFGNLETPLTSAPKIGSGVKFRSEPANASALKRTGFDVLSVANNHALDCGEIGLLETLRHLKNANLVAIGATNSNSLLIQNIKKVRVAWLAFSEFASPNSSVSTCIVRLLNDDNLKRDIAAAKQRADVVIVSCHWGIEYQLRPTNRQKRWARIAADAGADVVLGHHPHVWQGVQVLTGQNQKRKTLVAYSLGNWIFDVKAGWNPRTRQTGILQLKLQRDGVRSAQILPFVIENSRPRRANQTEKSRFWNILQVLAGQLQTRMCDGRIEFQNVRTTRIGTVFLGHAHARNFGRGGTKFRKRVLFGRSNVGP